MRKPITDSESRAELARSFHSVFTSTDSFGEMYADTIIARMILFPIDGFHLTENQYKALTKAAQSIGDHSFFVSEIERKDSFETVYDPDRVVHWEVTVTTPYADYRDTLLILENAMYSKSNTWGAFLSSEDHAVIGGSQEFIQACKTNYPDWQAEMDHFKSHWETVCRSKQWDVEWLYKFLAYANR
ncbi:hypothetical protein [Brevibacillus sp. SAFN-007a]|uniref:hypothetical protein n=1 Tax=Brevibacillus sp. SAFN-007a TaxID=3436862 RepID=UPI003F7F45E5